MVFPTYSCASAKLPLFACLTTLIFSCASLTAPGGGPDDKTGPQIVQSFPAAKSTNVSTGTRIGFTFSEWISTKNTRCVSIFPPVDFSTRLHSNKLEIQLREKLQDSTTYHVLITSALLDLHGNPLSPYNLIFSTGPSLDSGSIRGCVLNPGGKAAQYRVALFTEKDLADSGACGSPSYLMQTDTLGRFDFANVKVNSYHAIAYIDANNDAHLQSGTEAIFTTEDSLIHINQQTPMITFFPSRFDTTFPLITNLKAVNDKVISAAWSKAFDSLVFHQPVIRVERLNPVEPLRNVRYTPLVNSTAFMLCTDTPLVIAPYRVVSSITRIFDDQTFSDTVLFNGNNAIDTTHPKILIKPDTNSVTDLKPAVKLIWSKPVTIIKPVFLTGRQGGDSVATRLLHDRFSDTTVINPVSRLNPGTIYRIVPGKDLVRDLYGNSVSFADSGSKADTVWIRTINSDSIATSLQGSVSCLEPSPDRLWFFTLFNSPAKRYLSQDSAGIFRFDSLNAGKGQIGYFIDKNKNGIPDKGTVYPWHPPEPYFTSADTVEARARWDIEGISVQLCDPCMFDSTNADTSGQMAP